MTIGGPRLRQHIVEFVRGVGVIADGVTNASVTASPWSWTVPDGVRQIFITGVGGGGGGSGGANNATTSGGGGGGGAGVGVLNFAAPVRPNSVLTITVGQGGSGGPPSTVVASGETTSVAGLLFNPVGGNGTTLELFGGQNAGTTSTTGNGRIGGACGVNAAGNRTMLSTGGGSGAASGTPGAGGSTLDASNGSFYFYGQGGGGGGGANTTTSLAGAAGGGRNSARWTPGSIFSTITNGGAGATNGTTLSQGGGGNGGDSLMGCGGQGGNGGVAGGNATGYGAGGGGGGGSANGGAGTDGYLAIVYWAAD